MREPFQPYIEPKQRGEHTDNPIEKGPAGSEDDRMAKAADPSCQQGIAGPYKCRQERQQIAHGIQLKPGPVEADQDHTGHGHPEADEKTGLKLLPGPAEEVGQDGGEKRRHGYDNRATRS